jgi:hypothetical protein
MNARCALLACLVLSPVVARADVSGTLTNVLGTPWPVRDAMAYREGDSILVVLSSLPFDWIDFAADGKLDIKDRARHNGSVGDLAAIELRFDAKGYFRNWDGTDSEPGINPVGGWKPGAFDTTRIAGRFDYASTDVTFDVTIRDAKLDPSGEPLTADSEAVKALVAYFAAMKKRDLDAVLAATMPPEQLKAVDAEQRERFAGALSPSPLKVDRIEFRDGIVFGDVAQVRYAAFAKIPDSKVRRARLDRIDGRWIVRNENID